MTDNSFSPLSLQRVSMYINGSISTISGKERQDAKKKGDAGTRDCLPSF